MANDERNRRAKTAKAHDDAEMIEESTRGTSQSGSAGGNVARDVGSRDEKKSVAGDTGLTRVEKHDKIQPNTGTRSDHEGG